MDTFQSGALVDDRSPEEQEKDYRFEEVVAAAIPVHWREKREDTWRRFPKQDQDGSGSCVAQTARKMLGVYTWLKTGVFVALSASHIYQRRSNRPSGGMIATNCLDIIRDGTTLEELAPSQQLSDAAMDAIEVNPFEEKIGNAFKIDAYLTVPAGNIETVASIIQETGKAVMVWFFFTSDEWSKSVPTVDDRLSLTDRAALRHSVAAVDFTLYNGQKALIIEDSAHFGGLTQRIITEEFFRSRNFFVGHFMAFAFEGPEPDRSDKPQHSFTRDMEFSPTVHFDIEVVALQDCLKWLGLFPSNVESTGYFGAVTRKAVQAFQVKYGIAGPTMPGYGRAGPHTRAALNDLFS